MNDHEYRISKVWFPKSKIPARHEVYLVKNVEAERKRISIETGHKSVRIDFEEVEPELLVLISR